MAKNKIKIPVMTEIDESVIDEVLSIKLILKNGSTNNYVGMAIAEFKTDIAPINARFVLYRQTQKAIDAGHLARIGWRTVNNGGEIAYTTATTQNGNNVYASESTFSPTWKSIIDLKVDQALVKAGYKPVASIRKEKAVAKTEVTSATDVTEETTDAVEESVF